VSSSGAFDDVLAANDAYAGSFALQGLPGQAKRGLAVVTCMDSRIEPLAMLGLSPGDAKILRNAGARVTDDVLRTLVLATYLLGVERVLVIPHTKCKMTEATDDEMYALLDEIGHTDVRSLDFGLVEDQLETLRHDVQRIKSWPYLPQTLDVAGFRYDVDTGRLEHVC
jgi:carbonic anhydrase